MRASKRTLLDNREQIYQLQKYDVRGLLVCNVQCSEERNSLKERQCWTMSTTSVRYESVSVSVCACGVWRKGQVREQRRTSYTLSHAVWNIHPPLPLAYRVQHSPLTSLLFVDPPKPPLPYSSINSSYHQCTHLISFIDVLHDAYLFDAYVK